MGRREFRFPTGRDSEIAPTCGAQVGLRIVNPNASCRHALRLVLDSAHETLADIVVGLIGDVPPQLDALHQLIPHVAAFPSVSLRKNAADFRVVDIGCIEIAHLGLRRVEPQLVHVAILIGMVASRAVPDSRVPDVHRAGGACRPDFAGDLLVAANLAGANISEMRSRNQEGTAHLVGGVVREERQLDVEIVLSKIDDRVLVRVRSLHTVRPLQMHRVMVIDRIRTDQRMDKPFDLRQTEHIAERRALWPRLLERGTHLEIAAVIPHVLQTCVRHILRHHLLELQIA